VPWRLGGRSIGQARGIAPAPFLTALAPEDAF